MLLIMDVQFIIMQKIVSEMKFILPFILLLFSCFVYSKVRIAHEQVFLKKHDCESGYCIEIMLSNKKNKAICIHNDNFPYDGALEVNAFNIVDEDLNSASFRLIEPSLVAGSKHAALVRLLPANASVRSIIDLTKFYDIKSGSSYLIEYSSRAYFCDDFGGNYIYLSGKIK